MPPTKSMRLSVRGSPIASSGPSTESCSRCTSSDATGSAIGRASSVSVCHCPARYIAHWPFRVTSGPPVGDGYPRRKLVEEHVRRAADEILHDAVVRAESASPHPGTPRPGTTPPRVPPRRPTSPPLLTRGLRAARGQMLVRTGRACRPMVAVGDVEGRHVRKRPTIASSSEGSARQMVCSMPSAAVNAVRTARRPTRVRRRHRWRPSAGTSAGQDRFARAFRRCGGSGRSPCRAWSSRAS